MPYALCTIAVFRCDTLLEFAKEAYILQHVAQERWQCMMLIQKAYRWYALADQLQAAGPAPSWRCYWSWRSEGLSPSSHCRTASEGAVRGGLHPCTRRSQEVSRLVSCSVSGPVLSVAIKQQKYMIQFCKILWRNLRKEIVGIWEGVLSSDTGRA